MLVDCMSLVTS
jgi:hypothetical protein